VTILTRSSKPLDSSYFKLQNSSPDLFAKLNQVTVPNFDEMNKYSEVFQGHDTGFSVLGTTMANSPTNEAYRKVEMYAVQFATICKESGLSRFYLVTSEGADPKAYSFYSKTKGEVEEGVKALGFKSVGIFRPCLILGIKRSSRAWWETPVARVSSFLNSAFPAAYQQLHLTRIAQAMVLASVQDTEKDASGTSVYGVIQIKQLTPDMSDFPEGWHPYDGEIE